MAAIEISRPAVASHGVSFISRLRDAIVAWNDKRLTRNALNKLSDRELEDIGIARGDIQRMTIMH